MRYQIVAADSLASLEKFVNNELKHDWVPTGGLISFIDNYTSQADHALAQHFAQAMLKPSP